MARYTWTDKDVEILMKYYPRQEIIPEYIMIKMDSFKSWDAIKRKANSLGLSRKGGVISPHSNKFLLGEIKRFYNTYNKVPTHDEFAKHPDYPSTKGIRKRFKTWNNAIMEAGLEVNLTRYHSKEDVIEMAQAFYSSHGRSPFYNELTYSRAIIYNYWEDWDEMLSESGLPPTPKNFGVFTKDKNGQTHRSKIEAAITNVLIDNKLIYTVGNRYDELMDCNNNYLVDWVVYVDDKQVIVEYFGLNSNWDRDEIYDYKIKMDEKVQLCVENGLNLVAINQNDLTEGFSGLIKKFKHAGISLIVEQEHIDSIGYRVKKIAI